jgi:hypothetical protein
MGTYYVVKQTKLLDRTRSHLVMTVHDVPSDANLAAVRTAIDAAGLAPAQDGISWGNHVVSIKPGIRGLGEVNGNPKPVYTWGDLLKTATRPVLRQLNVRIPATLYHDCEATALALGMKLRPWVEKALTEATTEARMGGS